MNKILKEQLNQVQGVVLPEYGEDTTSMHISKPNMPKEIFIGSVLKVRTTVATSVFKYKGSILTIQVNSIVGTTVYADCRTTNNKVFINAPLIVGEFEILEDYNE